MKKLKPTLSLIMLIAGLLISAGGFSQDKKFLEKVTGSWIGMLKYQGTELHLVFNISKDEKGNPAVTIDSPDQGAQGIKASINSLNRDTLIIVSEQLRGGYNGKFIKNLKGIRGTWRQNDKAFPITLERTEETTKVKHTQEVEPPYPYTAKEVIIINKQAGVELSGTLTLPNSPAPYPGVILITGSGPQNRDEELLGHKPFLVLSDFLTRNGIAVLRFDDRGIGKSTGDFTSATTLDFASDVSSAVDFMKQLSLADISTNEFLRNPDNGERILPPEMAAPLILPSNLGLIGHSEGGLIASIVASERTDISQIVLLAGPGLTGEKILLMQSALIARASGEDEKSIAQAEKTNKTIYGIIKDTPDNAAASEKIKEVMLKQAVEQKTGDKEKIPAEDLNLQIAQLTTPWFRFFLTYDPATALSKVKCRVLALNGSLDMQVPPAENLKAIDNALRAGRNQSYKVIELPGLNHLFQTAETGSPSEYAKIGETISPTVLDKILEWINIK